MNTPSPQDAPPATPSKSDVQETTQTPAPGGTRISKLHWDEHTEELLANWGDIAACFKWLHEESFRMYDSINYWFSLPIIILSTVTGTVSMSMQSLVPTDYVSLGQKVVGGVNIITGIITTIQNTFRFAQKSESHQNSSVGWSKLERNIKIELKIDRKNRKEADSFLKVCRAEYDRLLEQSPVIPTDIIKKFNKVFSKHKDIVKPDICDNLMHTEVTVPLEIAALEPKIVVPQQSNVSEMLSNIKEMLAESRIVPVNIKDADIPHHSHSVSFHPSQAAAAATHQAWRRSSAVDLTHLRPRKSFLGDIPRMRPLETDASVSVKDLKKKFEQKQPVLELTPMLQSIGKKVIDEPAQEATEAAATTTREVEIIVQSPTLDPVEELTPLNTPTTFELEPSRRQSRKRTEHDEVDTELKIAPVMDISDLL